MVTDRRPPRRFRDIMNGCFRQRPLELLTRGSESISGDVIRQTEVEDGSGEAGFSGR